MFSSALFVIFIAAVAANQKIDDKTEDRVQLHEDSFKRILPGHKEMLVRSMFQGNPKKLITAPRGFMKSTNLQLLRDGNSEGSPVLYVNLFAHEIVTTQQRVYELLREKIHLSYLDHVYLTTSDRLDVREKEICERWCSLRFTEMTNHAVTVGLTHLTRSLTKHWNRQVLLLIDEYDSIIMTALHSTNNVEFPLIVQLMYGQISKLVKYNDFVERVIVTGESFLAGAELAFKNDLEIYRFLDDHCLVSVFGLSESEVDKLLTSRTISETVKDDVRQWYGGYTSKHGVSIYNPYSVSNYLQQGIFKSYWRQNRYVHSLVRFLQISFVEENIKKMLRYECAHVGLVERANLEDLLKLKSFIENLPETTYHQAVHDLFFTYLFDQGHLSFGRNDSSCIIIPNVEVDHVFSETLKQHFIRKHKLNPYRLAECAKCITDLYSHIKDGVEVIKKIMQSFFKALEALFRDYNVYFGSDISSEEDFTEVLFAVANSAPGFVTKSKLKLEYLDEDLKTKKDNIDLYTYKGSFAIIWEVSHGKSKSPNSKGSLQRILDHQYYTVVNNTLYTPTTIDHCLMVGISTNSKATISITSLVDSKNITESFTVRKLQRFPPKGLWNFTRKKKLPSRRQNQTYITSSDVTNDTTSSSTE